MEVEVQAEIDSQVAAMSNPENTSKVRRRLQGLPSCDRDPQALYVKPTNEIYARHILATKHQQPAETLDVYLQSLKKLNKDCNYQGTSILYREESIRDAFITGRLLENRTLDLKMMFDHARSLESTVCSSESYSALLPPINAAIPPADVPPELSTDSATLTALGFQG